MSILSKMHAEKLGPKDFDLQMSDPDIRSYGWAVLAGHVVVLLYFVDENVFSIFSKNVEPLCWPYFQDCWRVRFDNDFPIKLITLIQAVLILAGASALAARSLRTYWIVMIALNAYLFAIVSLDYRLRGNQVYMLFWLNVVFLFWPAKRWAIPLILMSFYFWAGTLKVNYEWLSGTVLYHHLYIIPQKFAWLACSYVVVLEMFIIWSLLAERRWTRWLGLGQLALFHVESLSQIHWFYPLLMATLLSWFVIDWSKSRRQRTVCWTNFWHGRAPRSTYVLLGVFSIFQLSPYLYHGNKMLTGQGRIFALDMLEARQVCDVHAHVHFRDLSSDNVDLLLPELPPRKACDPIIYFDRLTNLCRSYASDPNFLDADFLMHSRRTTDTKMTTIVDDVNFCSRREMYKIFSNNSWMK